MSTTKKATPRKTAPRSYEPDWVGKLTTQSGPRTTAPMWVRPLLTEGEWAVYTALWSFGNWDGTSTFPTHQKLADRAFVARGTAANAVQKFDRLGLFVRKEATSETDSRNQYELREIPTAKLITAIRVKLAEREQEQVVARGKRKQAKKVPNKPAQAAVDEAQNVPSPAETPDHGGALQNVPPLPAGGTPQDVPPGTPQDVPGGYTAECTHTYPAFDLPNKTNPPSVSLTGDKPAARDVVAAEGGDSEHIEERTEERGPLDRIVDELVALSPGWDAKVTREVLEALAAAGRAPADVVRVATECAQGMHGVTQSPRRLLSWWPSKPATGAAQAVEPDWARGPVTYLPADRERCRVHSSEPSGACGQCKADKVAADAGEPVTTFELPDELAALSPVEAAKAMAARAKTGRRPHRQRSPEPVDEPVGAPPAAIGSLFAEVAASVGARA